MKTRFFRYLFVSLLLSLAARAILADQPVSAQNDFVQAEPAVVHITMPAGQSVFMQDQPVVLDYDVFNPASEPVFFSEEGSLGSDSWVQVALLDDKGKLMPPQDNPHGISKNDLEFLSFRVDPEAHTTGKIVPSRWFKRPGIGKYTLEIVTGQAVFRFPVTFVPDDHDTLKAMARRLGAQALYEEGFHARQTLIQEIGNLPATDALPVWQKVSASPQCRALIARELARKPSDVAANILAKSVWSGDPMEDVDSGRILDTMYNEGNPALRAHIKTLYAHHGVAQLPEKLFPPADDN